MRIWTISDTHCKHLELDLPDPKDIDMVIHAGDAGSHRDLSNNEAELREFLRWFDSLPYKHKIYIPGNHDTSIEAKMFDFSEYTDITILINESITIEGIKIFGSPYTPSFGSGWAYNKNRQGIDKYWQQIEKDTDIIVTHGPAKGILDYTAATNTTYDQCGCNSLLNHILDIKPKYHIFGHIHNESNILNCGSFTPTNYKTTFINACVMDLTYNVINNGLIIKI